MSPIIKSTASVAFEQVRRYGLATFFCVVIGWPLGNEQVAIMRQTRENMATCAENERNHSIADLRRADAAIISATAEKDRAREFGRLARSVERISKSLGVPAADEKPVAVNPRQEPEL